MSRKEQIELRKFCGRSLFFKHLYIKDSFYATIFSVTRPSLITLLLPQSDYSHVYRRNLQIKLTFVYVCAVAQLEKISGGGGGSKLKIPNVFNITFNSNF